MVSSGLISLFTDSPLPPKREPSAVMVSIFVHGCLFIAVLWLRPPRPVESKPVPRRYEVRIMELQPVPAKLQWAVQKPPTEAGQPTPVRAVASGGSPGRAAAPRIPVDLAELKKAAQTVVQPDAPENLTLPQEAALPQVMVWSARDITVKKIATLPQQAVAMIAVQPSLAPPNLAQRLADVRIAPTPTPVKTPLPPPSTTSPVNVAAAAPVAAHIPETASKAAVQVVPTSVISLSDVQLQQGTVALPPVNEVSPTIFKGPLTPGEPNGAAQAGGRGATASRRAGTGTGPGSAVGNGAGNVAAAGGPGGQNGAGGAGGGGGQGAEGGIGSEPGGAYTVAHVTLPRDGKFGVVVVGSSIADDYPETAGVWSGRLAYTVYLHVGSAKSWILQYSLPRAKDAAAAGNVAHLDAPWPYDLLRPSVDPDVNSDAIMVHGFVNTAGRFENLAVIFPNGLAEARFLVHALQQWQFRPAIQNGQPTAVEVLLIIPDQAD